MLKGANMKAEIEITRNNVSLAQFFSYVKAACEAKGFSFDIERESFENPTSIYNISVSKKNGIKSFVDFEYNHGRAIEPECEMDGAKSEISKCKPLDYQTYILNFDGTMFNEICEFTFYDEKKGSGYYYQASIN